MPRTFRPWQIIGLILLTCAAGTWVMAQPTGTLPPSAPTPLAKPNPVPQLPPPPANAIAATVNNQIIPELAVYRVLKKQDPKNPEARAEVLNFLVDTSLVDQYVARFPATAVDAKDIEAKVAQMRKEAKDSGEDFDKILADMPLTLEELRDQLNKGLRWDKFCTIQATDQKLSDFFGKNKNMFDGSQVRARHILVNVADKTPQAAEQAKAKAADLKKTIEDELGKALQTLPAQLDNLTREKERMKFLEKAFMEAAKFSDCPSKSEGGDVGWFPRTGQMVEPFARAAFALKPYQMSDVVTTEFGCHIILALEQKQGKDVSFDEAKPLVMEVYCERLRDAIVANQKPQAKIVINSGTK